MLTQVVVPVFQASIPIADLLKQWGDDSVARLSDSQHHETDLPLWVRHQDLVQMMKMGLGSLPAEAVGVPDLEEFSDIINISPTQIDRQKQLSRYFPRFFVAALYELQPLFRELSIEGYVVGGLVRDMFLRPDPFREVPDVDIVVIGDAIAMCEVLAQRSTNLELGETYSQFGTAKLLYRGQVAMDIASSRHEIYPQSGALPIIDNMGVPLALDVLRRDFTLNALALSIHDLGTVLDYTDGLEDIAQYQLRALHPATFFEDPSRLLRAMKFAARYDLSLSQDTEHLIRNFMHWGAEHYKGGGERIKAELRAFLTAEESDCKRYWLSYFAKSGWARVIHMSSIDWPGGLLADQWSQLSDQLSLWQGPLGKITPMTEDLRWELFLVPLIGVLPVSQREQTMERLALKRQKREAIHQALTLQNRLVSKGVSVESPPSVIYDLMHNQPITSLVWACLMAAYPLPKKEVAEASETAQSSKALLFDSALVPGTEVKLPPEEMTTVLLQALFRYEARWKHIKPELNGADLIELGVPEGEAVGQVLRQLTHARLDGKVRTRDEEVEFVNSRLPEN